MQGRPYVLHCPCTAVEADVFPWDKNVSQHHQDIDLIETIDQRIIGGAASPGKA